MTPTSDNTNASSGESAGPGAAAVRCLLDGTRLTLDALDGLLDRQLHVEIGDALWARVEACAESVRRLAVKQEPAYGINTGFGALCCKRISADQIEQLQTNLIISHAVGVGPPAPAGIVRLMMLFKALAV